MNNLKKAMFYFSLRSGWSVDPRASLLDFRKNWMDRLQYMQMRGATRVMKNLYYVKLRNSSGTPQSGPQVQRFECEKGGAIAKFNNSSSQPRDWDNKIFIWSRCCVDNSTDHRGRWNVNNHMIRCASSTVTCLIVDLRTEGSSFKSVPNAYIMF